MLSRSLREMVKGRWREFRREPSAFFFVLLMPIVWMVVLGFAFSSKDTHLGFKQEGATFRYVDFLIPGLLALSLLTTSLYGTGMTLVANRRENLLKRYRITPMSVYEFFASHFIGRTVVFSVEFLSVTLCGILLFKFRIVGAWIDYLVFALLGTMSFTALAILLGSRLRNASTYNGITNLVVLPMMLLSGIWFPRYFFPEWVNHVATFLPLTALVDGMRRIALEGATLQTLHKEVLVLIGVFAVSTLLARKAFRWY